MAAKIIDLLRRDLDKLTSIAVDQLQNWIVVFEEVWKVDEDLKRGLMTNSRRKNLVDDKDYGRKTDVEIDDK